VLQHTGYKPEVIEFAFNEMKRQTLFGQKHPNFSLIIMTLLLVIVVSYLVYSNISMQETAEQSVRTDMTQYEIEFYKQALKLKEVSLCDRTGPGKEMCIAIITNDVSKCKKLDKELQDGCIFNIAVEMDDEKICEKMDSAKGNCYFYFAIKRKDDSLCEKTSDLKQRCVEIIAE